GTTTPRPWRLRPLGAQTAASMIWRSAASGIGSGLSRRIARCVVTTSKKSICDLLSVRAYISQAGSALDHEPARRPAGGDDEDSSERDDRDGGAAGHGRAGAGG